MLHDLFPLMREFESEGHFEGAGGLAFSEGVYDSNKAHGNFDRYSAIFRVVVVKNNRRQNFY